MKLKNIGRQIVPTVVLRIDGFDKKPFKRLFTKFDATVPNGSRAIVQYFIWSKNQRVLSSSVKVTKETGCNILSAGVGKEGWGLRGAFGNTEWNFGFVSSVLLPLATIWPMVN